MDMSPHPQPLQIVTFNTDKRITLNKDVFRRLLLKSEIRDKYVSIVSINGVFRQGKSFLLNFFVRYLHLKYVAKVDVTNWLKVADGPLKGFSWAPGSKRHTTGIHMWSEIFLTTLPTGEEVAIILLDTQGAFDNQSLLSDCATIFSLSTLISSVQIYNVMRNIKQFDLSHLQGFGGYGRLISNTGEAPFQNLCFLVRDWACPYEKAYGRIGGAALLQEVFNGGDEPENKAHAESVKELYDKVSCFLMPYPGRTVDASGDFAGNLDDVDDTFKFYVQDFVESIAAPENLVLKKVRGEKIKATDLVVYISEYCKVLKESKLPKMEIVFKATVEAHHKAAAFRALKMYKKIMDSDCKFNPRCFTVTDLYHKHSITKLKAVDHYGKIKKFDDSKINDKYLLELKHNMEEEFKEYRKVNEEKLQEREEINRRVREMEEAARRREPQSLSTVNTAQAAGTAAAVVGGLAVVAFGVSKLFSSSRGAENLITDVSPSAKEALEPVRKNGFNWFFASK